MKNLAEKFTIQRAPEKGMSFVFATCKIMLSLICSFALCGCNPLGASSYSQGCFLGTCNLSLVSSLDGTVGNAAVRVNANMLAISDDGTYAAFQAGATNLTPYSSIAYSVIYRKNLSNLAVAPDIINTYSGNITDTAAGISYGLKISNNGHYVTFVSESTALRADVGALAQKAGSGDTLFLKDATNLTSPAQLISNYDGTAGTSANADISYGGDLTPDGRYLVFGTSASNLIPGSYNQTIVGDPQIYMRDLSNPSTAPVLVSTKDGTFTNRMATACIVGSCAISSSSAYPSSSSYISQNGRYVVFAATSISNFANITGASSDAYAQIYKKDLTNISQAPILVNSTDGTPAGYQPPQSSGFLLIAPFNFSISGDARYVAYTDSTNQVWVKDTNNITSPPVNASSVNGVTPGNGINFNPKLSSNGRYVAFLSSSSNLMPGIAVTAEQVLIKDLNNIQNLPRIVSSIDGTVANASSANCAQIAISGDGNHVVFTASASNLVLGVGNAGVSGSGVVSQVFLWKSQ